MVPNVYSRFEVSKPDGTKVKLRIQDMKEEQKQYFTGFLQKYLIQEETNFRAVGLSKSEAAIKELLGMFAEIFKDERAWPLLCCVDKDEGADEIVGCTLLMISRKDQQNQFPPVKTPENIKLFQLQVEYGKVVNLFEKFNVDEYLIGIGLLVDPNYRGCGIATELLKARKAMMLHRGFKLASGWFTSFASQRAGEKAGYELVAEISPEELGKIAGVTFTNCPPTFKCRVLRA